MDVAKEHDEVLSTEDREDTSDLIVYCKEGIETEPHFLHVMLRNKFRRYGILSDEIKIYNSA